MYQAVNKLSEKTIQIETPNGKLPVLSACYEYSQTPDSGTSFTGKRISYIFLTAYHDLFFKIRFTFPEKEKEAGEKALKVFLSDCGKLMRLDATKGKDKGDLPIP